MMKNLIYILIIIVSFSAAIFGQDYPKQGDYLKDDNLDKFVGTWEFESGNETFQIVLTKQKVNFFKIFDADMLVGWHIYIKDGSVVESSMANRNMSFETATIMGKSDSLNRLGLLFKDINRDRNSHVVFELIPGKSDEATWFLTLLEKVTIGKKKEFVRKSITIPIKRKWVLKKVK